MRVLVDHFEMYGNKFAHIILSIFHW